MPFPTRPEEIGYESFSSDGMKSGQDFQKIVSAKDVEEKGKGALYGLGQWYCEKENPNFCHLYQLHTKPFYGLTKPDWVLEAVSNGGETAIAFYGTYGACQLNAEKKRSSQRSNV